MWPFKSSRITQLIGQITAAETSPSARAERLDELLQEPPKAESLRCCMQIVRDVTLSMPLRFRALEGVIRHRDAEGVRALLGCLETNLRAMALLNLECHMPPAALHQCASDAVPAFCRALDQIATGLVKQVRQPLLDEQQRIRDLLQVIGTPDALALLAEDKARAFEDRNLLIPTLMRDVMNSASHHEVRVALAALMEIGTAEALAALETFRSAPARVVKKYMPDDSTVEVSTSEFGQRHVVEPPVAEISPDLIWLVHEQLPLLKNLHRQNSLAPVAAFMRVDGEILATALTEAAASGLTMAEGVALLQGQLLAESGLRACAVFYHGCRAGAAEGKWPAPAASCADTDCIVAMVDHLEGQSYAGVMPYVRLWNEEWDYGPVFYYAREKGSFTLDAAQWSQRGKDSLFGEKADETHAEGCFDQALRLDPRCAEALVFKATLLRETGHYLEALTYCDRAMALTQPMERGLAAALWRNQALCLHALERFEEEIALYDAVLASGLMGTATGEIWSLKGAAWIARGLFHEALQSFGEALRAGNARAAMGVQFCQQMLGDSENKSGQCA